MSSAIDKPATERTSVKKLRAAAVLVVAATAVSKAKDYAREHPDQASDTLDQVEGLIRGRTAAKYSGYIDKGSTGLRQALGLPARSAPGTVGPTTEDPDPDTSEHWPPHQPSDPLAPNPAPGTSDDPQPRHHFDDPDPMTPGERPLH